MNAHTRRHWLQRWMLLILLCACAVPLHADSTPRAHTDSAPRAHTDSAPRAGSTTLWFNLGALQPLGLAVESAEADLAAAGTVADYREYRFAIAPGSALRWRREQGRFAALQAGAVSHSGGPLLRVRGSETLDLRGFQLRHSGNARIGLEMADAQGQPWFTLDHAHHYEAADGALALRHMDLRLHAALARRLGHEEWTGRLVGGAQSEGAPGAAIDAESGKGNAVCTAQWPSATAQADVRMLRLALNWEERQPDGVNSYRCGRDDGSGRHTLVCTADSEDGLVVLAPDASLRNDGTASVAWHPKFSVPSPPYANDQHPYLVWNLYRLDADGQLSQIGVSAAKHAFHTINAACACAEGEILYPGCEDTYGGFSNDFSSALAPRSEIIPYTGRWGRCGSLYDKDCDGRRDPDSGLLPDDAYTPAKRLGVVEREILPARHPGARWFLEYWYVVREDAQPWNNIGLMEVVPLKVRGQGTDPNAWIWRFDVTDFHNAPMLQRWLDLAPAGSLTRSAVAETSQGRALLATRADALDGGRWRYQYQLFNLDLSLARTQGTDPDLRIVENLGLEQFGMWVDADAQLQQVEMSGVAGDGAAWRAQRGTERLDFSRASGAALDWGRSFRFSFVSDRAPQPSVALLGAAEQRWTVATLAPLRVWMPVPRRVGTQPGN
jgi:hypothetical protein